MTEFFAVGISDETAGEERVSGEAVTVAEDDTRGGFGGVMNGIARSSPNQGAHNLDSRSSPNKTLMRIICNKDPKAIFAVPAK